MPCRNPWNFYLCRCAAVLILTAMAFGAVSSSQALPAIRIDEFTGHPRVVVTATSETPLTPYRRVILKVHAAASQ